MKTNTTRPLRHKTHKCFGLHSRIISQEDIDAEPELKASGRKPGSKQVQPRSYRDGKCDLRTRAEVRNADLRRSPPLDPDP